MFQPPVSFKARLFAQASRLLIHSFLLSPEEDRRRKGRIADGQGLDYITISSR